MESRYFLKPQFSDRLFLLSFVLPFGIVQAACRNRDHGENGFDDLG